MGSYGWFLGDSSENSPVKFREINQFMGGCQQQPANKYYKNPIKNGIYFSAGIDFRHEELMFIVDTHTE